MMTKMYFVLIALQVFCILGIQTSHIPQVIGKCLSSDPHGWSPEPITPPPKEDNECKPWGNRACCVSSRVEEIHSQSLFHINLNLCSKQLSNDCKHFFLKESCFFECSPNLGLWLIEMNGTHPLQRYQEVPLCKSDCEKWFKACSNDHFCTDDMFTEVQNNHQIKNCSEESKCKKIKNVFDNADDFCEKISQNAYDVTDDKECMSFLFNGKKGNPNDDVAKYYYEEEEKKKKKKDDKSLSSTLKSHHFHCLLPIIFIFKSL